jgi:hypothetical protein
MSDLKRLVDFMRGPVTPKTPAEQVLLDEGAKALARRHSELKNSNPVAAAALVLEHGDEIFRGRSLLATEQPEPPSAA